METNELVRQIKQRVASIMEAEEDGKEAFVIARVEELRDFLNLAHADSEITKAARHQRAGFQPGSKLSQAIDSIRQ